MNGACHIRPARHVPDLTQPERTFCRSPSETVRSSTARPPGPADLSSAQTCPTFSTATTIDGDTTSSEAIDRAPT